MDLNFTEQKYYDRALVLAVHPSESHMTVPQAFLTLLHGVSPVLLANLTAAYAEEHPELTSDEVYAVTQGESDAVDPAELLSFTYGFLERGIPLGTEMIPGKNINSSDWLSHSLLNGRVCATLAELFGLDSGFALRLGMLHDYGRRDVQTLMHTIRGFELLSDLGCDAEAVGCLTHSFLNGGRCACMERSLPGFSVTPNGLSRWSEDAQKDDMARFLDAWTVTEYDRLLNLADLMATSRAIVSPADRVRDIATRRTLDTSTYGWFLTLFSNQLDLYRTRLCGEAEPSEQLCYSEDAALEQVFAAFEHASDAFFEVWLGIRDRFSI